ncbi:MAG TPA: 3-deoxy-manno-octulosonate cytidylyltransferase [Desulfosalsimonadaceae bacterium]|nr:3-deoxy-manno-octulosonate cytidylyltransferase [Desulfosalsimonadaceae bacterium]
MTAKPACYGIIPARYESSRFPGKPLADICGKPMFWHVYARAKKCPNISDVYLATDDERIAEAAKNLAVPVVLTRTDHPSGTDRVYEAATKLNIHADDVVINIQGDEPALNPLMLAELIQPFEEPGVCVTTPVRQIDPETARTPDRVKVVFSSDQNALYFSRSRIPFAREGGQQHIYCHIGMYAFRMAFLEKFVSLPPGRLETIEKLEQLRLLENHIPIRIVITEHESFSVDRPEDLEAVIRYLTEHSV